MKRDEKLRLALVSPNKDAYSETFIRFHRTRIDADVDFLYEGLLPRMTEDGPLVSDSLLARIVRKIYSLTFPGSLNLHEKALVQYLKRHRIDAILAEFGMTGAACIRVAAKAELPLLVHFHGLDAYVTDILKEYGDRYREMFIAASRIFVVSEHMYDQLVKLGCAREKLVLNPYGPGDFFFEARNIYKPGKFLAVGRFVDKKDPASTIRAFRGVLDEFPDAILTMVGDGPLQASCRVLAKELKMEPNVVFKGVLEPAEILALFEESMAFVQHSRTAANGDSEGTPVAILEAGASGLPVIATRHAGIPDVVVAGETGFLVEEGDIEGMSKAMRQLLYDGGLAAKMGSAARTRIKEQFTLERHIQLLNNCITQAIDNR